MKAQRDSPNHSVTLHLPPAVFFWATFVAILGLGNLMLSRQILSAYLFPLVFFLGAALPSLAVLARALRRMGFPITRRQATLALVSGSTLAVLLAVMIEMLLSSSFYFLLQPDLQDVVTLRGLVMPEPLLLTPALLLFFLFTALQAPIPEEFAKGFVATLFGRKISTEQQAFSVGLIVGAGFAILENMLYEGIYATQSGWSWGGITLLRAIGSVMHPLCTGIVALAWFRQREHEEGWFGRLARSYLLAVALHTLWNGGFQALVVLTGMDEYAALEAELSIYGLYVQVLLVIFLVAYSAVLWWLLERQCGWLARGEERRLTPKHVSLRLLAAWALVCTVVIVPIGVALGPTWAAVRQALLRGGN